MDPTRHDYMAERDLVLIQPDSEMYRYHKEQEEARMQQSCVCEVCGIEIQRSEAKNMQIPNGSDDVDIVPVCFQCHADNFQRAIRLGGV